MMINIFKNYLDGIDYGGFMKLLPLKVKKDILFQISENLNNSFIFLRGDVENMDKKNPQWKSLICNQKQLTDNFDFIYGNYFYEKDKEGISYDLSIILKCKTLPFALRLFFEIYPENFCDKNDLEAFDSMESIQLFFNTKNYQDTIYKSLNDYNISKNHQQLDKQLLEKKEKEKVKAFKI